MSIGFIPALLDASLNNLSQAATWEQATLCPCRLPRNGAADPNCAICHGNRFIWGTPVACRVALQGMKTNREFATFAEWEKGDILVTFPSDSPAYRCGEYDRFMLADSTIRMNQILPKGVNDKIKYNHVVSVENVWGIVGGVRVDFVQGVDFTLTGPQITWISNTLSYQAQYSITYIAHPEYYVYRDMVTDRPHGRQSLPRKVHLRLMELFTQALVT